MPDLTKGGTKDDKHDWTLGPTGARGWMWGRNLETIPTRQILVTAVAKGLKLQIEQVRKLIADIENATEAPKLRSIQF